MRREETLRYEQHNTSDGGKRRPGLVRRREGIGPAAAPASADGVTELAHELAGLLDGSMRWLSLAAQSLRSGDAATENGEDPATAALRQLEAASAGLQRMAAVVDAALRSRSAALGSPDLGGQSPGSAVTLAEAVDHAIDVVTPLARMNAVELRARIDPAAGQAPAGPLYSVVLNALRNAIEAIAAAAEHRPGGKVEFAVGCEGESGRLVIEVSDDGVGPPVAAGPDEVFGHGFSTKGGRGGIVRGLGLAIARELVEQAGGTITLKPRGLRESGRPGAVLRVVCPLPCSDRRLFGRSDPRAAGAEGGDDDGA